MDPRIALAWLRSTPRHELTCYSCHGVFGAIEVRVGINLVTDFDVELLETVIIPRAFAYLDNHRCNLTEHEYKVLLKKATEWAEASFERFAREYSKMPLIGAAADTVSA